MRRDKRQEDMRSKYMDIPYVCEASDTKKVYISDEEYLILVEGVYEPAEDTWQTLEGLQVVNKILGRRIGFRLCLDVGSGSGVLLLGCTKLIGSEYYIGTDVNPCAVVNVRSNLEQYEIGHVGEVVQCDGVSCIRELGEPFILVFNAPYLEAEDEASAQEDIYELSFVGGRETVLRVLSKVAEAAKAPSVVVLTISSLTRLRDEELEMLGYKICGRIISHYFFEDIITLVLCRWPSG